MKFSREQKEKIKSSFYKMNDQDSLLSLLNMVKGFIYPKAIPFRLNQLTFHSNPNVSFNRYVSFKIAKKSGKLRVLHAPTKGLKIFQKCLNFILQCVFEPSAYTTGFVLDRSVVENAKVHINSHYVFNIDLEDFFHSIDQARVWKCLQLAPFFLTNAFPAVDRRGYKIIYPNEIKHLRDGGFSKRLKLANIITAFACTAIDVKRRDKHGNIVILNKNVLPQGAPTSPILTNVICQQLDNRLSKLAKSFGLRYTRYADDITFSSQHNVYQQNSSFIRQLRSTIEGLHFRINENKIRLQHQAYTQQVTGLIVNDKVNVRRKYIRWIRMWLYYLERYGYNRAQEYYSEQQNINHQSRLIDVLHGKINYLKMVKGADDESYQALKARLNTSMVAYRTAVVIDNVLSNWKRKDYLSAVQLYNKQFGTSGIQNESTLLQHLLSTKIINRQQKDQLITLASNSIANSFKHPVNKTSLDYQEKKYITQNEVKVKSSKFDKKGNQLPFYPSDPRNIAKFLNDFNQNIVLKATTHEIDNNLLVDLLEQLEIKEYDYQVHMKAVTKEFEALCDKYRVNRGIVGKMNEFLFQKENDGWSADNIKINWNCPEIKNWCNQNKYKCPNPGYDLKYASWSLPDVIYLPDGSSLSSFNKVISRFKGQIEFRDDTDLSRIISRMNRRYFSSYEFNTTGLKQGIRFYSDVEKVAQAYKNLIHMCIDYSDSQGKEQPNFSITLDEQRTGAETRIVLSIRHVNSIFGKTALTLHERYGASLTGLISSQLDGICDLSLKAAFPNSEFNEISLWPKQRPQAIEFFEGVQFDLTFFRLS
jgi:RNA-directed DNA polymerase